MDRPLSLCHCYHDDGTRCDAPAVADSLDPDDPYCATPVCADHTDTLEGTIVPRKEQSCRADTKRS